MGPTDVVSRRTWAIAVVGVIAAALFLVLLRLEFTGSGTGQALLANSPSLLAGLAASGVVLWAALSFDRGEPLRRQWLLVGSGMTMLLVGDVVFAYLEVLGGQDVPFPSVADVFYLLSFPLLAAGVLSGLLGFRGSIDLKKPLLVALGVSAIVTAVLWVAVFQPVLVDTEVTALEKTLGVLYPAGDVWLLLFPAAALALALSPLGGGRLAWPWWGLVVGFTLIAAADTAFTLLESAGGYVTGSAVDLGWWLGYMAIAVAASLLVDVQRPIKAGGGV